MKAQGLPITAVVIVVFGLIILFLVLVFIFNINPLAGIFDILRPSSSEQLRAFAEQCEAYCIQANGSYHPISNACPLFCSVSYNSSEFDGIEEDHCYPESNDAIRVDCLVIGSDGNSYVLNSTTCKCP